MPYDLGRLAIREVIVHEVPRRFANRADSAPILSDIPSGLDQDLRNYFKERIALTLGAAAIDVERDESSTSPIPAAAVRFFARPADFVAVSREAATHLFDSQNGSASGGLLVVIDGTLARERCLGILKLEKEEGVRVATQGAAGTFTFRIEHLRALMLTNRTRVFKTALFPYVARIEDLKGCVSDNQRGFAPESEIADFFLRRFLGCRLTEAPDVTTQRYFDATESFINGIEDAAKRARYEVALIAELASQRGSISPRGFAADHLDEDDRDVYLAHLREAGAATTRFDKDTHLVSHRIKKVAMDLSTGIQLLGTVSSIDEHVTVSPNSVSVQGRVTRVRGRG